MGEVVAVGCAVPVLFAGRDERGVSFGDPDLFGLAGNVAFSVYYEENLVGGVGVELVLGPVVEVDQAEVVVLALVGPDNRLPADASAVEDRGAGGVFFRYRIFSYDFLYSLLYASAVSILF